VGDWLLVTTVDWRLCIVSRCWGVDYLCGSAIARQYILYLHVQIFVFALCDQTKKDRIRLQTAHTKSYLANVCGEVRHVDTSIFVSTWMGNHQGRPGRSEPGSVRRCGLESLTDRLFSRYLADTDVKWIKPNLGQWRAIKYQGQSKRPLVVINTFDHILSHW